MRVIHLMDLRGYGCRVNYRGMSVSQAKSIGEAFKFMYMDWFSMYKTQLNDYMI